MAVEPTGDYAQLTLRDYLGVLWRRSWIVIGVAAIVFGVGLYRSEQLTPVYQAEGQVEIVGTTANTDLPTQIGIIASPAVHATAARGNASIGTVHAQQAGLGNIVSISATDAQPTVATRTVNATIDAYVAYVKRVAAFNAASAAAPIERRIAQLQTQIQAANTPPPLPGSARAVQRDALVSQQSALQQRLDTIQLGLNGTGTAVNVIARPSVPTSPIRPNHRTDGLIALGAGLLLGLLLAFFVEYLVRSSRESRPSGAGGTNASTDRVATDVSMLGVLPGSGSRAGEVVSITAPQSPEAQGYRSLQTATSLLGVERGRCLQVTSAPERFGKTETIANLAVGLARSRRRVVVVDCDLREPRVHVLFGLDNTTGFSSVMRGARVADVVQPVPGVEHLYALTSGPLPDNPTEMLTSDLCREVLNSLLLGGTVVLVDTPPMLPFTDAAEFAKSAPVDAIMLVASTEGDEQVQRALDALKETGAPHIGVVLTGGGSAFAHQPAQTVQRWPRQQPNGSGANGNVGSWTDVVETGRGPRRGSVITPAGTP